MLQLHLSEQQPTWPTTPFHKSHSQMNVHKIKIISSYIIIKHEGNLFRTVDNSEWATKYVISQYTFYPIHSLGIVETWGKYAEINSNILVSILCWNTCSQNTLIVGILRPIQNWWTFWCWQFQTIYFWKKQQLLTFYLKLFRWDRLANIEQWFMHWLGTVLGVNLYLNCCWPTFMSSDGCQHELSGNYWRFWCSNFNFDTNSFVEWVVNGIFPMKIISIAHTPIKKDNHDCLG